MHQRRINIQANVTYSFLSLLSPADAQPRPKDLRLILHDSNKVNTSKKMDGLNFPGSLFPKPKTLFPQTRRGAGHGCRVFGFGNNDNDPGPRKAMAVRIFAGVSLFWIFAPEVIFTGTRYQVGRSYMKPVPVQPIAIPVMIYFHANTEIRDRTLDIASSWPSYFWTKGTWHLQVIHKLTSRTGG